jgi:phosphoglycolate phosphatase-like HAD superfamily hydrolase
MKNIQAFIFDMDGLLLDTERVYQRSWSEAARRLGFDLNDEIYLMLIGITVADSEKRLAEVFGFRFPIGEFRKDAKSRYETIVETEGIPLKPGVREMLEWARHKNIPCAVATSTVSAEAQVRLAKHGILKEFRQLIGGEMVSRGKPHPTYFSVLPRRWESIHPIVWFLKMHIVVFVRPRLRICRCCSFPTCCPPHRRWNSWRRMSVKAWWTPEIGWQRSTFNNWTLLDEALRNCETRAADGSSA